HYLSLSHCVPLPPNNSLSKYSVLCLSPFLSPSPLSLFTCSLSIYSSLSCMFSLHIFFSPSLSLSLSLSLFTCSLSIYVSLLHSLSLSLSLFLFLSQTHTRRHTHTQSGEYL